MLRLGLADDEDILAAPKVASGRWGSTGAQAEQGLERRHRRSPPIMTEHKLIEVHLQLRTADTVVRADQPLLQVADRAVGERDGRRDTMAQGRSDRLRVRDMAIAFYRRSAKTRQAICVQCRAWCDMSREERLESARAEIRDHCHAHTAGDVAALFDGDQHQRGFPAFQLPTPAQPGLRAANPRVIQFDVSMQRFSGSVDHGPPELVEEQPGRFISSEAQLPLQPQGRRASFIRDHQIAGPEPDRQRRFRVVEDGARRERHLMPASGALPASMGHRIGPAMLAPGTDEPVRPSTGGQILLAGFLGRKLTLEFAQILRKRRARHAPTLQIVAC
jgi:hypothetical protein